MNGIATDGPMMGAHLAQVPAQADRLEISKLA